MAIFFDAPVEPDELTQYVRDVPSPAVLGFTNLFPRRDLDTNTVDFAEIVRTNRTARYRSWDGRVHVSERDTGSEKRVKLLPLSSSLTMGEYERVQLEFARTGGTNQRALAAAVYNDATNLTREVQFRLEQAWGDVIADGKLTINEGGYAGEADFGVPGNQVVTAATVWTDLTNGKPLTDLLSWSDVYNTNNGVRPGAFKSSLRVLRLMQRSKEVIDAVYGSTQGRTRVNTSELIDLLSSEGLPTPAGDPYDTQVDVDGVATRVFPDDRIALMPSDPGELGYTAWGVTATALELVRSGDSELTFEEAPGIVGVVDKSDGVPYREQTIVDAAAMPILANARLLMVADVA